jgi:uncharacterized protein YgbK (DUF1537 family)
MAASDCASRLVTVPASDDAVPADLPQHRPDPTALHRIRAHNADTATWIVVLDDDPTGSQAVYNATVLLDPATEDLLRAAHTRQPTFVWTNTRGMPEAAAIRLNRELVRSAIHAATAAGVRPVFVSRGDSTLRGHFAAEISAVTSTCNAAGRHIDGVVFVPAFLEAGRFTARDVQWVAQPHGYAVPAAETEFARDATFGYREANLRDWVTARTSLPVRKVRSVPLEDLRTHGPDGAEQVLLSLREGDIAIGNAVAAADLEALALACQSAERAGRRFVYRTGPSFIRALAGQPPRNPLTAADLSSSTADTANDSGLTVVGSHTALTTRQLDVAVRRHRLTVLELDVDSLLEDDKREDTRTGAVTNLERALRHGDAALITTRSVRTVAGDPRQSLAIARRISDAVCAVVAELSLEVPLRYVVAKGGITSHEVAARGLGMRQATVLGQMFPGQVSVLRLGPETPRPGTPYVVFPGNVGTEDSLAHVLSILGGAE